MDPWELTVSLGVGFVFLYFFKAWIHYRKFPPGPWGLPIVGYLPFVMFRDPVKVFAGMKKKYGKIFGLRLGNFDVVVLNDYKLIRDAFDQDVFNGRPAFEIQMYRNHGEKRGILVGDGKTWSEQRRFVLRNLRNFGFGKQTTMTDLLTFEAGELIQQFDAQIGKPFNLKGTLNASVLNSLWYLITGSRFDVDDSEFQFCVRSFTENLTKIHATGIALYFPWLLKQNWLMPGLWKVLQETRDRVQGLVRGYIEGHRATFDPNLIRDLLDALLDQQRKTTDPSSSFYKDEGNLNILIDLVDLFLAGAETTSTTLQWLILYIIAFPDVQVKVHEEIDRVLGSRSPTLEDRSSMVYIEATLNETHRFSSLLPLSVSHNTFDSVNIEGYKIPKDTVILANTHDVHFDPTYWTDPETFDPSRFIDPTGSKLLKFERLIPFSIGKRQCLGMELAKETLFIFFTTLMQRYTFTPDPSSPMTFDLKPFASSLVVAPKPYNVIFTPRIPT